MPVSLVENRGAWMGHYGLKESVLFLAILYLSQSFFNSRGVECCYYIVFAFQVSCDVKLAFLRCTTTWLVWISSAKVQIFSKKKLAS